MSDHNTIENFAAAIEALKREFQIKQGSAEPIGDRQLFEKLGSPSGLSASTLQKICKNTYQGNIAKTREIFNLAEAKMRLRYNLSSEIWMPERLHDLAHWEALKSGVRAGIKNARLGKNRKITWVKAWPGFGKTTSSQRLKAEFKNCHVLSAQESWHKSYFAILKAVAHAVGVTDTLRGVEDAESKLFAHLRQGQTGVDFDPPVVVFDEVEFSPKQLINLWKLTANTTPVVIVIFCQPPFFEAIQRRGGIHAAQMLDRNIAVIEPKEVKELDALLFLKDRFPSGGNFKPLSEMLARHANGYGIQTAQARMFGGGFRFCYDVCEEMSEPSEMQLLIQMGIYRSRQGLNFDENNA